MDDPLCSSIGNSLEVETVVEVLLGKNKNEYALLDTTIALSVELYSMVCSEKSPSEIKQKIYSRLESGHVAECFEKMDCAEAVPAWDITCDRDDKECLARKRQLAQQDLKQFKENPGGAVGVVALLALRPILGLFRRRSE